MSIASIDLIGFTPLSITLTYYLYTLLSQLYVIAIYHLVFSNTPTGSIDIVSTLPEVVIIVDDDEKGIVVAMWF